MSLLEAIVALIVMGLAGTGFLELFHDSLRAVRDRSMLARAEACAVSAMEATKSRVADASGAGGRPVDGCESTVAERPWGRGLREVIVVTSVGDGRTVTLRRVARRPEGT